MNSSNNGWAKFWDKRGGGKAPFDIDPFVKNFDVMKKLYEKYSLDKNLRGKKSLEIGCGRATISTMFELYEVQAHKMDQRELFSGLINNFKKGDVLKPFPYEEKTFDLVFSYGLEEHFDRDELRLIWRNVCGVLKTGGIYISYVVPAKLSNLFESRDVPRHRCTELIESTKGVWVFPCMGGGWITNRFLGKGYIYHKMKHDIGGNNGKCNGFSNG